MNFTNVAEFAGAMIVLPMIMQAVNAVFPPKGVPARFLLLIYIVLSAGWGLLLFYGGQTNFKPPVFVVQTLITAFSAAGVHAQIGQVIPALAPPAPGAPPVTPQGPNP